MLARLTVGEASVTELPRPFAISLPAVSKRLGVLVRAGRHDDARRGGELAGRRATPYSHAVPRRHAQQGDQFPNEAMKQDHEKGWLGYMDKLAATVA